MIRGLAVANPYGVLNTTPPFSPPLMFSARVRYDWSAAAFRPFAWAGASHIASLRNVPANFPDGNSPTENPPTLTLLKYTIPAYTTYDAALGVAKDSWTAQITGSNLSNAYAATNISSGQFIKAEIPLRPRVLLLMMSYRF